MPTKTTRDGGQQNICPQSAINGRTARSPANSTVDRQSGSSEPIAHFLDGARERERGAGWAFGVRACAASFLIAAVATFGAPVSIAHADEPLDECRISIGVSSFAPPDCALNEDGDNLRISWRHLSGRSYWFNLKLSADGGTAEASWNDFSANAEEGKPLGSLKRADECWEGEKVSICFLPEDESKRSADMYGEPVQQPPGAKTSERKDYFVPMAIFRDVNTAKSLTCYIFPSELYGMQIPTLEDVPFTVTFTEEADGKIWANGQPIETLADETEEASFEENEEGGEVGKGTIQARYVIILAIDIAPGERSDAEYLAIMPREQMLAIKRKMAELAGLLNRVVAVSLDTRRANSMTASKNGSGQMQNMRRLSCS